MGANHNDTAEREFVKAIEEISSSLNKQADLIGDEAIYEFTSKASRVSGGISEIRKENRLLKIGIVGGVKAGKSSFLNALVFGGDEILPKAPTPMTAALTCISYAEAPEAKVVFYKGYDWRNIKKMADRFNGAVEARYRQELREYEGSDSVQGEDEGSGYTQKSSGRSGILGRRKRAQSGELRTDGTTQEAESGERAGSVKNRPDRAKIVEELKRTQPEELVSSFELIAMVEERNIDPTRFLDKEEVITGDPREAPAEYIKKLEDYVGAEGRFTPLVNHLELKINIPMLEGLEIIDTPGLNDPIVSRGNATKKYLSHCDVVFIVCPVNQFLTSQDIALISKNLSEDSVGHAYIIGSQLDSGILTFDRRVRSFQAAYNGSLDTFESHAERELKALARGNSSALIRRLMEDSIPPKFVSALMYGMAKKMENGSPFNSQEKHILEQCRMRFSDFDTVLAAPEDYYDFANIDGVRTEVYDKVRAEKEPIIRERVAGYMTEQTAQLISLLERINIAAKTSQEALKTGDIGQLEKKLEHLDSKLTSIRVEVQNIFANQAVSCRKQIEDVKVGIAREVSRHTDLEVVKEKEKKTREERYGFLGLMRREVEYTVETNRADAREAVENVQKYGVEAQRIINENLRSVFDAEDLKDRLKRCVIGAFDLADKEFNPNEILLPLETLLGRLTVNEVQLDFIKEVEDAIYGEFPDGMVVGNDIHKLHRCQNEQMNKVLLRLSERLDETRKNIEREMTQESGVFVDGIQKKVADSIKRTKKLLGDRSANEARFDAFIKSISGYKKQISRFQE